MLNSFLNLISISIYTIKRAKTKSFSPFFHSYNIYLWYCFTTPVYNIPDLQIRILRSLKHDPADIMIEVFQLFFTAGRPFCPDARSRYTPARPCVRQQNDIAKFSESNRQLRHDCRESPTVSSSSFRCLLGISCIILKHDGYLLLSAFLASALTTEFTSLPAAF